FPSFDPAVQTGKAAIDRIAEDVRDRLTRPRASRLGAVPIAVQLLTDLRDPLSLEVPSEDERDDPSLLLLHLEDAVDIVVAVGTCIREERSEEHTSELQS